MQINVSAQIGLLRDDLLQIQTVHCGGRLLKTQEVSETHQSQKVPKTYKIHKGPPQGYSHSDDC